MAAEANEEAAGNADYTQEHMSAIFQEGFSFSGYERDYLALNQGGHGFVDVSGVSGIDSIGDGRGSVYADFDNDGDLDVFLVSLQRTGHELFRNNTGNENGFVRIEPVGRGGADAYGTVVRLGTGAGVQTRIKAGGSGFLGQHDPRLLFGLGSAEAAQWVEITWPDGRVERFDSLGDGPGIAAGTSWRVSPGAAPVRVTQERFALADPLDEGDRLLATLQVAPGRAFPDLGLRPPGEIPGGTQLGAAADSLHDLLRPGRRLLVNLWATWCVPCRREMPELERLVPGFAAKGIDLVGVSIDAEALERIVPFVREAGATYPIYGTADARVADLYVDRHVAVPLSFLLDDRGRILEVIGGWSAATSARFERLAR